MEIRVYARGEEVGICEVESRGLYWEMHCICSKYVSHPVRLYGAGCRLGILEAVGDQLTLTRRLAKSAAPAFSTRQGLVLVPVNESSVNVDGVCLSGDIEKTKSGSKVYVPYVSSVPHPAVSLMCFWQLRNGFWVLCLDEHDRPVIL